MRSLPSLVLSKHSHRKCKHPFWSQVWTSVDSVPWNAAFGTKGIASTQAANVMCSVPLRLQKKGTSMPLTDSESNLQLGNWKLHLSPVIHCSPPVNFLATKSKNYLFSVKSGEESKEAVCLIRQPAQATRGVDRLSSAVWEEAELQDQSPTRRGQASGCR